VITEYKLRGVPVDGTRKLGPDNGRLTVNTTRQGAASKAGHDLLIEVGSWEGTLDLGEQPSVVLEAEGSSLRVLTGTGGIQTLDDDDRSNIKQTIDQEVLRGQPIEFRSTEVSRAGEGRLSVTGDLTLVGNTHPVTFELVVEDDGRVTGSAAFKQSDWGIKPYSALFGALKVADEVTIGFEAEPPA
jgi:hypothetical protein